MFRRIWPRSSGASPSPALDAALMCILQRHRLWAAMRPLAVSHDHRRGGWTANTLRPPQRSSPCGVGPRQRPAQDPPEAQQNVLCCCRQRRRSGDQPSSYHRANRHTFQTCVLLTHYKRVRLAVLASGTRFCARSCHKRLGTDIHQCAEPHAGTRVPPSTASNHGAFLVGNSAAEFTPLNRSFRCARIASR